MTIPVAKQGNECLRLLQIEKWKTDIYITIQRLQAQIVQNSKIDQIQFPVPVLLRLEDNF